jgi:hypothetical protein
MPRSISDSLLSGFGVGARAGLHKIGYSIIGADAIYMIDNIAWIFTVMDSPGYGDVRNEGAYSTLPIHNL